MKLLTDWKLKLSEAEWHRKRMSLYSERALEAVQKIYGIVPAAMSGAVANGPMADSPASWKPRFSYLRSAYRVQKRPGGAEYYIETLFKDGAGGVTDEDGQVNIGVEAFAMSVQRGTPLILALAVHHEGVHFGELLTRGWDTHDAGEIRAWKETLVAAQAMGVDDALKKELDQSIRDIEDGARLRDSGVGTQLSPFHSENIQFEADFNFEKALMDSQGADLERNALSKRLEDSRAEAAGQSEEAKKAVLLARMEEEAARCGFKVLHPGNWDRYGFYEEEVPGNRHLGPHLYFGRDTSWEELRAALFLARVCLDEGLDEPCNDGLEILNRRWGWDGFGEGWGLEARGGGGQQDCLNLLQARLKTPMSVKGMNKTVSRVWKELRKRWKAEGEAAMRRHRQEQEEALRPRKSRNRDSEDSDEESRCGRANSETGIVGCRPR